MQFPIFTLAALGAATLYSALSPIPLPPSSHREAPAITTTPKVDATDFYLFNSYEAGRENYVTAIANYLPLQEPYGGPNYFSLDPNALYEIHFDRNGDAVEDLTFQFRFALENRDIALTVGSVGNTQTVSVPLINLGPITAGDDAALNVLETYGVTLVEGDRRQGTRTTITQVGGGAVFQKPVDNIGQKSLPDYEGYVAQFVYDIALPGGATGRLFVGQRKDPFVVNLGETFDLVNVTNVLGEVDAEADDLEDSNVTSLILELPRSFLVDDDQPVLGAWTTASLRQARVVNPAPTYQKPSVHGGAWTQVSRLASPLVNELVIGLKDKDLFNSSEPVDDAQFLKYVTHPTLPEIIEILFKTAGVEAPTLFPRNDLVAVFLTGVDALNLNGAVGEMLRLNTAIPAVGIEQQNNLGVIGGDNAGFPNGRRPGDDVVDIALRVAMGALLPEADAPSGKLPFTDGAFLDAGFFDSAFPYLRIPVAGSPNETQ